MKTINVTAEELRNITVNIIKNTYNEGPYSLAFEYGFPGFSGGEDHLEIRKWSLLIVDRGLSTGSGYHDSTTRFSVVKKDRKGTPPLKEFVNV